MTVHDDKSLDAELDLLRAAPAPRAQLRRAVLNAIALEPRRAAQTTTQRANPRGTLLDALAALWRDLGGARLAAPAFAMALAAGIGLSWLVEDPTAGVDDSSDDLVALAQLDDAYEGLEP